MPMDWQQLYGKQQLTAKQAVLRIPRGTHIFVGMGAAEPVALVQALVEVADHFSDNTIVHLMTLGPAPYVDSKYSGQFRHDAFFIGQNVRKAVHDGRADYTPVFLSRIPDLIRSRRLPVDVALIQCSPPDQFGFVNLGVSVDISLAAIEAARLVIAEINPNVPVVPGAGFIQMDQIDSWIYNATELLEMKLDQPNEVELEIGRNVATLIEDGSTIQMGIGQIPDATLRALTGKRDLGVWTEMFSDGVIDLVEQGVITGKYKTIHPKKISASFTIGTKRLYDFIRRNPRFTFHPSDLINDPVKIAQQHKMVAINSALEVDFTGQVCADSIGTKFYSGIGGQVDFIRGAAMCPGGKPTIALPSMAKHGSVSRIVATLTEGAGVVTTRGDVRYVVTEYGVADLLGKNIRERAVALISIAHPSVRAELLAAAKDRHYVFVDQIEPRGEYPRELERAVHTKHGTEMLLRPIRATDEPKLSALFYALTDNTLYKRFMRVIRSVPHEDRQYFLDVDYRRNMAIVLETRDPAREPEIVGVAQYFAEEGSAVAEAAFVVRDEWQGMGLGQVMMRELIALGRAAGFKGFVADVLASNSAMLHLFRKSGQELSVTESEGTVRVSLCFGSTALPV